MELIGCPETSVRNHHYAPRNIPAERRFILLSGGSLKSRVPLHCQLSGSEPACELLRCSVDVASVNVCTLPCTADLQIYLSDLPCVFCCCRHNLRTALCCTSRPAYTISIVLYPYRQTSVCFASFACDVRLTVILIT